MVLPAAILPPREFGTEVSEAMFCSNHDLPEMRESVGERVELSHDELKEVHNHIMAIIN